MRKEPYSVGSIVHIVKRGARGLPITRGESDQWRFLMLLYFLNDSSRREDNWEREVQKIYLCLIEGKVESKGKIETLLGRSPNDRRKQKVRPEQEQR